MQKIPVVAVVGATASGKTSLAIEIAKHFNGEIVSADSMQIYKGMDIATAKPTEEEKQGIAHHLMDIIPVEEKYSVARFVEQAGCVIRDIHSRGKLPVVCGGTGLYIDSLLNNTVFEAQEDNTQIRQSLEHRRDVSGIEVLYEELKKIDPEYAEKLHINNEGRIIRALEMYHLSGEIPTVLRKKALENKSPYDPIYISIEYKNRELLYDRIDSRVEQMLLMGLEAEAKQYFAIDKKSTASQAIGYKELAPYFNGSLTLEAATENLKRVTRRYAKRQLTWFRRNPNIYRIYADALPEGKTVYLMANEILETYFNGKKGEN